MRLLIFVTTLQATFAFTATSRVTKCPSATPFQQQLQKWAPLCRSSRKEFHRHFGTIYYPSWEEDDQPKIIFDEEEETKEGEDEVTLHIKEVLSSTESVAPLARVAAAFCPTGQALDLRSIEHVDVLSFDKNHIDIEAVVCEEDGCVTLEVPVEFPHSCSDSSSQELEECIIDNLHELDCKASKVLKGLEWKSEHDEEIRAEQRIMQNLRSTNDVKHWASWWVRPFESALLSECDSICNLLNEEGFQDEVKAMASIEFENRFGEECSVDHESWECLDSAKRDNWHVAKAAVAEVGPAGVLVRARLEPSLDVHEECTISESSEHDDMELFIHFADHHTARDVAGLRTDVLELVDQAASIVEG